MHEVSEQDTLKRNRYYSLSGSHLPSPVREPEELHQWLESFASPAQDWQHGRYVQRKVSILESMGMVVWVAIEMSEGVMEAELVPTVELINCWPRPLQRWPIPERARSIKSFGFNLMATSNYHWLLCFSRAEQALLGGVGEDGGCRRKCYRVVRQLKEDIWCADNKPVITVFHLQTLSFWRCVQECVLLRVARNCVSQRYLCRYFVRNHNLLKFSNATAAQRISDVIANPSLYIH
ncbi:LOW QUALITY PROTEIN: protein mab-21-like 3 [Diretmus argenteus]